MKIQLIGALPRELRELGLKPGDTIQAFPAHDTGLGAVIIKVIKDGAEHFPKVYPENFMKR